MNEQQYEKLLNINTAGFQYGFPKLVEYHRYEPTPYEGLDQLFENFKLPCNGQFVDIGCGKGRVPIYIHHHFHIPTVGIEMDPKFFREAENNRQQYMGKAKKRQIPIDFQHLIAEKYEVAPQDNVFFFFNPFSVHILRQVMSNILYSAEQHPRQLHFILYYPSSDYMAYFEDELEMNLVCEVKLLHEKNVNERIVVFEW